MPPATQNPLVIAAYVAGILISIPFLAALVRLIFFFATTTSTLSGVVKKLDELIDEMREYRREKSDVELRLSLVEKDVEQLKRANIAPLLTSARTS
jgi:uncharacterized protein YoxC